MGCLFHKGERGEERRQSTVKEYSWDKRGEIDPKDYTIEDLHHETVWKLPGSVDGRQFVVRSCTNTTIYIFDHINTITIDECRNCKIILGPVRGSFFLRDSKECLCVVACGQFRARDCRKVDVFLCCPTQPVVESSSGVHFGCYQLFYEGLEEHFFRAGMSFFNNEWSDIHDFTPLHGENNWCLLPDSVSIRDYIMVPNIDELKFLNMSLSEEKSIVPLTWGPHKRICGESCLVIFFSDGQQVKRARAFVNVLRTQNPGCLLLLSKEIQLNPNDAEIVFRSQSYNEVVQRGRVVGLKYCGENCIVSCQKVAVGITTETGSTGLVYVGTNPKVSHGQAESFFNLAQMQLNF